MKNFPTIFGGKEYWVSRSIAVVIKVTAIDENGLEYVLAVQRGKGTPDSEFVGSWCLPCGYLDFDETIKEAACRELKEETGLEISPSKFNLVGINDEPESDKRQNVTFRYVVNLWRINYHELTNKYSEKNEVSNIKWIPINELNKYKWAFNHNKLINEL